MIYEYRIARRALRAGEPAVHVGSPEKFAQVLRKKILHHDREHFFTAHLNNMNLLVGFEITAIGGAGMVEIHPREVFRGAIMNGATGVLVAHTHPSGSLAPSEQDDFLTERLVDAGELLGVPVLDHLILTLDSYYSYSNEHRFIRTRQEPP